MDAKVVQGLYSFVTAVETGGEVWEVDIDIIK